MREKVDVVVVGAGIAGLAAAHHLADRDVRVLEAADRWGGRIKSVPRGDYWLSVGAHMFPGPDSQLGELVRELGLELLPIDAELLGMSIGGRTLIGGRPELYPFRLPMSLGGRASFIRAGLKLRRDAARFQKVAAARPGEPAIETRIRQYAFEGDRSFHDYIGRLHPEAAAIFNTISRRMTAEPDEISAGSVISLFAHVFASDASLAYSLNGGATLLTDALARRLGDRVRLNAPVTTVRRDGDGVVVEYEWEGEPRTLRARSAIVTCPAPHARTLLADAGPAVDEALAGIPYGPLVVGAILTDERTAMPWDDMYSVVTPSRSFTMVFNHAAALRRAGAPRKPGGALMVYGGANLAKALWGKSDDEVREIFANDLYGVFPEARGVIAEMMIERWEHTVPFAAPGRHRLQRTLEQEIGGTIFLAGDYVGDWVSMDSAAATGIEAAGKARVVLDQVAVGGRS